MRIHSVSKSPYGSIRTRTFKAFLSAISSFADGSGPGLVEPEETYGIAIDVFVFFCKMVKAHKRERGKMIFGVLNQKGGVGKTTLSVNLAACLARAGSRVLLIDADPQGSSLDWAAAREGPPLFTVVGFPRASIHKEIGQIGHGYDHIVIDGPPRVTDLARSAIMAADIVVIPVQPSPYDIWAAEEVVKLIDEARVYKEHLKSVFVVNRKITNTAIGRDVRDALAAYPIHVLRAAIAQRVVFAEAAATGLAVFEIDSTGPAAAEMEAVAAELMEYGQ